MNEAYGKLRDPLSRAKYLFALKSGATSVDDERRIRRKRIRGVTKKKTRMEKGRGRRCHQSCCFW